mmetsp:Transcript_13065/g.32816  ORF Transcript_13065/g.32816 Transcript_13065/m.32816 type:complete len:157 (-) Transcript_13065:665-1135(-)
MAAMFAQTWSAEVSAMAARAKEALGEDQVEALAHVGAMQARWLAAFLVLRGVLFRKRSSDFSNRIVSIVHGVSIVVLTAMLVDWQDPFARVGRESNAQEVKDLVTMRTHAVGIDLGGRLSSQINCFGPLIYRQRLWHSVWHTFRTTSSSVCSLTTT